MKIGIPEETSPGERLVALTPDNAADLQEHHDVYLQSGAGEEAGFPDHLYEDAGVNMVEDREEVFHRCDVIFQVRALGENPENAENDLPHFRDGQILIAMVGPYEDSDAAADLAEKGVTIFAMELVPRISRAQSMDAQTALANIGGYKSVILAADTLPRMFPMMMTAAGTVQPANVFVLGAGVAGLQAIATAKRLGAEVKGYDIRPEVKEQVESLGADFIELDLESDDASEDSGHAREMDEEFYRKQREMLTRVVAEHQVVITTAAVPGKPSPELITDEMIEGMSEGSVIVDLAAAGGGNCSPTEADETVNTHGVTIFGPTNLPATVPYNASQLYANNLTSFLNLITDEGNLDIDHDDEIIRNTLLAHDGQLLNPHHQEEEDEEEEEEAEANNDDTDVSEHPDNKQEENA
jgi:NAD(P) transhydrogenase subunit alpha